MDHHHPRGRPTHAADSHGQSDAPASIAARTVFLTLNHLGYLRFELKNMARKIRTTGCSPFGLPSLRKTRGTTFFVSRSGSTERISARSFAHIQPPTTRHPASQDRERRPSPVNRYRPAHRKHQTRNSPDKRHRTRHRNHRHKGKRVCRSCCPTGDRTEPPGCSPIRVAPPEAAVPAGRFLTPGAGSANPPAAARSTVAVAVEVAAAAVPTADNPIDHSCRAGSALPRGYCHRRREPAAAAGRVVAAA